ncbi:MAG: hypothetical protein JW781_03700 [Deltaproteobacteria bacterium]|nr:hypothetical protein [Candidatus Anaeroferrophillacea bacterium]
MPGGGIFLLIWNARRREIPGGYTLLGIAYALVGTLDLLHAMTGGGLGILAPHGTDTATRL